MSRHEKDRKKYVTNTLNHGFDGRARQDGSSDEVLFQQTIGKLEQFGATSEEIEHGLYTAHTAHEMLRKAGRLTEEQAARANRKVDIFRRFFRGNVNQRENSD